METKISADELHALDCVAAIEAIGADPARVAELIDACRDMAALVRRELPTFGGMAAAERAQAVLAKCRPEQTSKSNNPAPAPRAWCDLTADYCRDTLGNRCEFHAAKEVAK